MATKFETSPSPDRSQLGRIGRSTGLMFLLRIISQGITFLTLIVLAQALGPHAYGQYAYILGFLVFFTLIVSLGINEIVVREISARPENRFSFLQSGMTLKGIATLTSILLAMAGFFLINLPQELRLYALLSTLMLVTSYSFHSYRTYFEIPFQVDFRMEIPSLIFVIVRLMFLAFLLIYIPRGITVGYAITLGLLSETIGLAIFLLLSRRRKYLQKPAWDSEKFRRIIYQSWPIAIAGVFVMVYMKIDIILIQWLRSSTEVGYYAVSMRLVDALAIVPTVFVAAALPVYSRAFQIDPVRFQRWVKLSFRLLLAVILPVVGVTVFYAPEIIHLLYGPVYAPSAKVLSILIFAAIFVYSGFIFDNSLVASGKQRYTGYLAAGMALCNVVLNILLIPQYGIVGAAWATVVSYGLGLTVALLIPNIRRLSAYFWLEIAVPIVMVLLLGYLAKVLHLSLLFACLCVAGGFYVMLHLLGILTYKDIKQIVQGVTRREA